MNAITSRGIPLDTSPGAFGELRSSADVIDDVAELRRRMDADGYLFLPGCLDRGQVLAARDETLRRLEATEGRENRSLWPELARDNAPLREVLYGGRMIDFYERFLGEPVRHYDYTWLRAIPSGRGTAPHADSVFMNRGTVSRLFTAWTPLGDIDTTLGGLIVLPGSHRLHHVRYEYGTKDVDAYCANLPESDVFDGTLSDDPRELREQLGMPWLTADFQAGDLLTFTPFTVHASLDNGADEIRLSCDSRYQPASLPADERWIGPSPSAHGPDSKLAFIC
ncbi:phytanoyl-CoA dioxygenase family protein [Nonomuraea sp. NPDC059194]|uniref:phytanoyl-CoA dioxygenase family protein n=1 Tax=Nonomuraea sp. NPDC059194 TaxID=3346764 RepID=UPI0036BC3E7E